MPVENMPIEEHIYIYRGDSWSKPVDYIVTDLAPLNAVQWSARAQIRSKYDPDVILATMGTAISTIETNTGIRILLSLTSTQTALLSASTPKMEWDLEVDYPDGSTKTLLRGRVKVKDDVTHDA